MLLNSIVAGLSAPTESVAGIATATLAPAVSYEIGQQFKNLAKENADSKLNDQQKAVHVLAHAVLGAAVAATGGNDAMAGALSAGGAEAIAPVVSQFMYGTDDPEKLTAEQKETITSISSLAGVATGAVVGNSATNAVQGGLNAENAVENNSLSFNDGIHYANKYVTAKIDAERKKIQTEINTRSAYLTDKSITCKTEQDCLSVLSDIQSNFRVFGNIADSYESSNEQLYQEQAKFLREQQKESLKDIERIGHKLNYLYSIANNKNTKSTISNHRATVTFQSSNGRVWNDGRFAASLDSTKPDYMVFQIAALSIYIPLYRTDDMPLFYVGGSIAKDQKLKSSYGISMRFGEILSDRESKDLKNAGVYKPSTKWITDKSNPNHRGNTIHKFLPGQSISTGGCLVFNCINRVDTGPTTSIESGIGISFSGASPASFEGSYGVTLTPQEVRDLINKKGKK